MDASIPKMTMTYIFNYALIELSKTGKFTSRLGLPLRDFSGKIRILSMAKGRSFRIKIDSQLSLPPACVKKG